MLPNIHKAQTRRICRALFVAAVVLVCVLSFLFTGESLSADSDNGTVPPYDTFASQAAPSSYVDAARDITLVLTVTPKIRNFSYPIKLQVTSTIPVPLALVPNSVSASVGRPLAYERHITLTHEYATGAFTAPLTLRYVMRTPSCIPFNTGVIQSVSVLRELGNNIVITPTTNVSTAISAIVLGGPRCGTFMPQVMVPQFPTLQNGNLDQGQGIGWTESPEGLIYQTSAIPAAARDGANSSHVAWLGGNPGVNTLAQTVHVPFRYLDAVRLKYYAYAESAETVCTHDTANVFVNSTLIKNFPLCNSAESNRWEQWVHDIPASAIVGDQIELRFQSVLNGSLNSNWFLNRIELCQIGAPGC